jgi:hypothetical protein
MCDCIRMVNENNAFNNTKLVTTSPWYKDDPIHILLMVEKVDPKKRKGPIHLIGAYCPFCGQEITKLPEVKP